MKYSVIDQENSPCELEQDHCEEWPGVSQGRTGSIVPPPGMDRGARHRSIKYIVSEQSMQTLQDKEVCN